MDDAFVVSELASVLRRKSSNRNSGEFRYG